MSVFNSKNTVRKAIESIISQDFENLEFLILDDCSTDNTFDILQEYAKKDNRLRIFKNEENIGLTKSLNILIDNSKGTLIARQDADDISMKNRLSKQVNQIRTKNLDFVTSRAIIKDTEKVIPRFSIYVPKKVVIKFKNPFIHGTLLIKKETIKSIGMYDERFLLSQDYKLFTDLIRSDYKYKVMKDKLYILNMENNISQLKKVEQEYYADCVRKNKTPKTIVR